jgi:hypothetical protein
MQTVHASDSIDPVIKFFAIARLPFALSNGMGYAILCPDDGICSIGVRSASIIEKWEETFRSIRFFC